MCFRFKKRSNIQQTKERLRQLTAVSELATTEYTIAKVVKAEDTPSLLRGQFGDRKLLYSCKIYVKAGIDLEGYDPAKTEIDEAGKSIKVVLPHAKMLSFNMPAEECKLAYGDADALNIRLKHGEKNQLWLQGAEQMRQEAEKTGILADAERNAETILRAVLRQSGYKYIHIKFE